MEPLLQKLESQLARLPVTLSVALPGNRKVGPPDAAVRLEFQDWSGLATLAAGQIGKVAEDYVEKRVKIDGTMRDVMAIAAALLPGSPVPSDTGWFTQIVRRARSVASHTLQKDAEQIRFHYDVSDDFYALWLDPRRVYSCAYYRDAGIHTFLLERDDSAAVKQLLREITRHLERRSSRANRILIAGIPNVGKSTLINLLAERKIAKVGDEPAVTKARQEIRLTDDLVLLDTPGILWPKIEDQQSAYRLAATGAIRNTAFELGDVGLFTVQFLQQRYPERLRERYGVDPQGEPVSVLEEIGRKRGSRSKGGIDFTKAGETVVNDLRTGKLGLLSLETPDDILPPSESVDES